MKAPLSWLSRYVQIDMPVEELASRLALSGTEVERITDVGVLATAENLECLVVGKVLTCERHPNADKLSVCTVDVGRGDALTIVCGAPNVAAGQTVAAVLPGGVLPGGMVIKEAKLRGVPSAGMLLSEAELGLTAKSAGIMVLPEEWSAGEQLAKRFAIADQVLEVEVTPNRPDCLCIKGLAREIAAVTDQTLLDVDESEHAIVDREASDDIDIRVEAPDLCPRYAGRIIRGVKIGESPLWLKALLSNAGMRPVSNAVDVTNYVLWCLGQPLHAFDLKTIRGGRIIVRRAKAGETLTTLDGQVRKLDEEMLVIADAERASVVAGIMGGLESEITAETTDILLEGANFSGPSIMRTSGELGLRSEASTRYEKGLDPEAIDAALDMACGLIVELCGGAVSRGTVDVRTDPRPRRVLELRGKRVTQILGVEVPSEEIPGMLEALGCEVVRKVDDFMVTVPTYRADLEREIDLVEEIARIYGLDNIPETLPARSTGRGGLDGGQWRSRRLEDLLVGAGLVQLVNYSFGDQNWPDVLRLDRDDDRRKGVVVTNPLSADQSMMRTMLLPGLLTAANLNMSVRQEQLAIFEKGRVYMPGAEELPAEPERLGLLVAGPWFEESWLKPGDAEGYFLAKGLVERVAATFHVRLDFTVSDEPFLHPGKRAQIVGRDGKPVGWVGEIHPLVAEAHDLRGVVAAAEVDVQGLLEMAPVVVTFRDLLAYPSVEQDVALVVGQETPAQVVVESVRRAGGELLEDARVFDLYEGEQVGEGKKSIALRLSFRSAERTLSEEEVNRLRAKMLKQVSVDTGAELRNK